MFYYLLDNSSFLQKYEGRNKQTSVLIYGTIIYIIFHFILSNFKNKNLTSYFWVIFSIDVVSICINTNITSKLVFKKPVVIENEVIPQPILKKPNSNKKKTKKRVTFEKKEEERKSTSINDLINKKETENLPIGNDIDTDKEDEINITLADLQAEVSDGNSDIDLESFEKNYFN